MKKYIITLAICLFALTSSVVAADIVTIDNFSIIPGETKNVNISLANESEYVAFQFDLYLPDSLTVESYSADRSRIPESTTLSMTRQQDGSYRFITMAINGDTIIGTSGPIVNISVRAHDEMAFGESTGYFRKVKLSRSNATGPTYNEMSFPVTLERPRYAIRYLVDNEIYHVDSVGYGLTITPLDVLTRVGYTFSGWSDIPATMPAQDVEISGTFSINSYILTYKVDGFDYRKDTLAYNTTITPLTALTRVGYTFSGWSDIPSTMPANDVEVTGSFTVNKYILTYKVDDADYKKDTLVYNAAITPLAALTKVGYTFSGWSDIPATMPASDVEVTGSFSINSYILTYKVDGADYKKDTLVYDAAITPLAALTKVGYTFSGWSDIPATMPASDVEITGSFSINSYILTYKVDGADYKKDTLVYNAAITPLAALTKEGYTFSGWSDIPAMMPASDVEITGSFSINSYVLTYKVDGADYKKDTLAYNAAITPLAVLTKEGYTFSGWSDIPAVMPAYDVEVTGSFTVNKYILTYKVDGVDYKKDTLVYNTAITPLTELTRLGYTFSGWSDIPATMPASDVEVIGSFTANKYILTYKVDGVDYKKDTLAYNTAITPLAIPTKEGYSFSGWSDIPAIMPALNVEVTGSFSINTYTLTYKVDGFNYYSDTLVFGTHIIPLDYPTKDGFTFLGWSMIPDAMPANNLEIVGHFIEAEHDSTNVSGDDVGWGDGYNLIYKIDGQIYKTIVYESGGNITAEPEPTKEGYTFSGWSDIPATMPASDVEITGSFSINSYVLTYKVDGVDYKKDTLVYNAAITPLAALTKEGYTFSGWSDIPATMPANDVEITGSFSINKYILTYKVDSADYKKDTLVYNAAITPLAALTKEGYTFSGWSDIPVTMPANDVEITGSFSINSYVLTYKVDGADYNKDTLAYNATITPLAALTKVGYTFSGWSDIPATMPASDVEITGSFSINSYVLTYKVDGAEYKKDTLVYNAAITPLAALSKEGYTFSGWSDIPATMPANDVEVIGSFMVNKYLLTVLIDGIVVYSDSIAYGARLADYADLIKEKGIDITQWEWYSQIETITMPAHDVVINAVLNSVRPIRVNQDEDFIYDLSGKKMETDDISTLPAGMYIRNGRKFIVR